jgi:hypothetical protein
MAPRDVFLKVSCCCDDSGTSLVLFQSVDADAENLPRTLGHVEASIASMGFTIAPLKREHLRAEGGDTVRGGGSRESLVTVVLSWDLGGGLSARSAWRHVVPCWQGLQWPWTEALLMTIVALANVVRPSWRLPLVCMFMVSMHFVCSLVQPTCPVLLLSHGACSWSCVPQITWGSLTRAQKLSVFKPNKTLSAFNRMHAKLSCSWFVSMQSLFQILPWHGCLRQAAGLLLLATSDGQQPILVRFCQTPVYRVQPREPREQSRCNLELSMKCCIDLKKGLKAWDPPLHVPPLCYRQTGLLEQLYSWFPAQQR